MKKLSPLLAGFVLIANALVSPPAGADFVHLSFFAEDGGKLRLRGGQPDEPWDTYGYGAPTGPIRLDVFYDRSALAGYVAGGNGLGHTFTDPDSALWRLHTTTAYLPPFDFQRPIDNIEVGDYGMTFTHSRNYGSFDLELFFASPPATGLALPFPPLDQEPKEFGRLSFLLLQGGEELFELPAQGSGMIGVEFTSMRAELVDKIPPLTPVPEPSGFGLMGAAALGALMLTRRRELLARRAKVLTVLP